MHYSYFKFIFSLKPVYLNQLVGLNVFTLLVLDILYLVEKVAQHQSFKDFSVEVDEVMVLILIERNPLNVITS